MKPFDCVFTIAIAIFLTTTSAADDDLEIPTKYRISTSMAAWEEALKITGFDVSLRDDSLALREAVQQVTLEDSTTPYLSDSIDGRTVWQVEFPRVQISQELFRSGNIVDSLRDFTVYLDAIQPGLIMVVSRAESFDQEYWKRPCSDSAAQQLLDAGEEYLGFPEMSPPVPFAKILTQAHGNYLVADEISAIYVINRHYNTIRPAWVIQMLGGHEPTEPRYINDHLRTVVDAVTGEWVFARNKPRPEGTGPKFDN